MRAIGASIVAPSRYGAFELKQSYRRSMLIGIAIAALLHVLVVTAVNGYRHLTPGPVLAEQTAGHESGPAPRPGPPPSPWGGKAVVIFKVPGIMPPDLGTVQPVPDEEFIELTMPPTSRELAVVSGPAGLEGGSGPSEFGVAGPAGLGGLEEDLPPPAEFTAVQEQPATIHFEKPEYPDMAELTGQSGNVWVQALVDSEGRVREARVLKSSGT